jgi:O-antigen/teichoic acid export membrane protein
LLFILAAVLLVGYAAVFASIAATLIIAAAASVLIAVYVRRAHGRPRLRRR